MICKFLSLATTAHSFNSCSVTFFWSPGFVKKHDRYDHKLFLELFKSYALIFELILARRHQKSVLKSKYGVIWLKYIQLQRASSHADTATIGSQIIVMFILLYCSDKVSILKLSHDCSKPVFNFLSGTPEGKVAAQIKLKQKRSKHKS